MPPDPHGLPTQADNRLRPEEGSFRDRHGRVFYVDGTVYRGLSPRALEAWRKLSGSGLFAQESARGRLVETREVFVDELDCLPGDRWAGYLRHESIPFVTYPYEWCFGMLKDAALLQLELLAAALDEDLVLKDASPYNTQWVGTRPLFIDISSFDLLEPGEAWHGYRQFCEMFLNPLMLCACRNVPFQPFLRGRLDGIDIQTMSALMPLGDWMKPGVMVDVFLHARLQRVAERPGRSTRQELKATGFRKEMIKANLDRVLKVVHRLQWKPPTSAWSEYPREEIYGAGAFEAKKAFVERVASGRERTLSWDIGCNDGTFARLLATRCPCVVAMDSDHGVVERLYQQLKRDANERILPLVTDVTDPAPRLGWRGRERKTLEERGRPGLVLGLALLHHLVISGNIPLPEVVDWLRELGGEVVLEFVTRSDPQVQGLLRNKDDQYADYDQELFERLLGEAFEVTAREEVCEGRRFLYHGCPRS